MRSETESRAGPKLDMPLLIGRRLRAAAGLVVLLRVHLGWSGRRQALVAHCDRGLRRIADRARLAWGELARQSLSEKTQSLLTTVSLNDGLHGQLLGEIAALQHTARAARDERQRAQLVARAEELHLHLCVLMETVRSDGARHGLTQRRSSAPPAPVCG